jgi:threonine aldolase
LKPIDLRSDTVTKPTAAMRRAMAEAEVGDDIYGEDPTVRRLEERIAQVLGLPAALYVPSGTQANQIAIGLHCRQGDEVLADADSHIFHYESGGLSGLWGVQPAPLAGNQGLLTPEQVTEAVRTDFVSPRSRLVSLENTHNRAGGRVWPLALFGRVAEAARAAGLGVHMDGARLFNAAVATGIPASSWASLTDSTAVCFSKGLGAPVGSALLGSREFIQEARRLRKRLGGGMRQVGILAAGALYALEHHVERLAEDHVHARRLAAGLAELSGVKVDPQQVETNMVVAEFPLPARETLARLAAHGVLAGSTGTGPRWVRLVTHLDVSSTDIDESLARIRRALAG